MDAKLVNALATDMGKRMRRWSAEKLDKESMFAAACNDGSDECEAWELATKRESERREKSARGAA